MRGTEMGLSSQPIAAASRTDFELVAMIVGVQPAARFAARFRARRHLLLHLFDEHRQCRFGIGSHCDVHGGRVALQVLIVSLR